jgi:hypothetical protein
MKGSSKLLCPMSFVPSPRRSAAFSWRYFFHTLKWDSGLVSKNMGRRTHLNELTWT